MVRAFVHYGGGAAAPTPDSEPPKGLDWDMWCGPAPLRPLQQPRSTPRASATFLDYANGQLGDWGIHWMDQILWWTEEKGPQDDLLDRAARFRHQDDDNTTAPRHPGGELRVRLVHRHLGAPQVYARQPGREAQHRLLLLRHRGDLPHGLAGRLDLLPGQRQEGTDPPGPAAPQARRPEHPRALRRTSSSASRRASGRSATSRSATDRPA